MQFDQVLPQSLWAEDGSPRQGAEAEGALSLRFAYALEDGLDGLYRSTYTGTAGGRVYGRRRAAVCTAARPTCCRRVARSYCSYWCSCCSGAWCVWEACSS